MQFTHYKIVTKMKKMKKITLTILLVLVGNLIYAQNISQDLEELEGTWKYQDDETEFYLILLDKQVEIKKGRTENRLIGFSKLIHNGKTVYNRLSYKDLLVSKSLYKTNELYNTKQKDSESTNPDFYLYPGTLGLRGTYGGMNYATVVNIEGEYQNDKLTLHFSKPKDGIYMPQVAEQKESLYANHIPALPSTWVLERVTEDKIEE